KFTRILAIDGGGIRGIIPAQILVVLEQKLQQKTRNPEARLADFFDLIAGTSTGGLLAGFYLAPHPQDPSRPRYTTADALEVYLNRGGEIFDISLWHKISSLGGMVDEKYPAPPLEAALRDYFQDVRLRQLIRPCLIPAYDIEQRKAVFFNSMDARSDENRDFLVRDVLRAATAAPMYFEVSELPASSGETVPLVDGGVFCSNPAMCAYAEVRNRFRKHPTAKKMVLLSLGTGRMQHPWPAAKARHWGQMEWSKPLFDIFMSAVEETVDFQVRQIFHSVGRESQYLRINEPLKYASPELDNVSPENLDRLRREGQETAERSSDLMDEWIRWLLK
ncbi:MAG: patatin, partial [Nitrospinaceae bacterium]|nr:patatin [Nitrospinaceae bacterium]NIR57351.1 patatin [Nitrospinaceae bacterium]NIS87803.1 patatin [Nitrospinaceae bacterium]NIT84673.1 patatin [Nitrospinaceae bacterium]NIU46852.1 patatin [Nitrospinaceae bacterium]